MAIFSALKIKNGEMLALAEGGRQLREQVVPIFDVVRPTKKVTTERRVDESAKLLIEGGWCKPSSKFYVDTYDVPAEADNVGGMSALEALVRRLSFYSFRPGVCCGFDRGQNADAGLRRLAHDALIQRLAIRLETHDLLFPTETVDRIRLMLADLKIASTNTLIIHDLRVIDESAGDLAGMCVRAVREFERHGLAHHTFLASSMWDWSRLKTNTLTVVPRVDLSVWQAARKGGARIAYGDYGVISPNYSDPEDTVIPAPKLRYTTARHWLISKGEKPRKGENSQYPRLARKVLGHEEFRSNDLSWGHEQLRLLASYGLPPIGHSLGVAIDTNNHLELVVDQVREFESSLEMSGA